MYTRSYTDTELRIPEKYGGTALDEIEKACAENKPSVECLAHTHTHHEEVQGTKCEGFSLKDFWNRFTLGECGKGFKGILDGIGCEEILIIGLAILLFFCSNPDRECALILLALVFIK